MRLQVRVGHTRALLTAAALTLAAGAALAWTGFRALAERERTVGTQYAATTVLVRDRLTAELTRIESELRADFVRAAASLHDRAAGRHWLSQLTRERPWIADPVLFDGTGRVLTPDLAAGWRAAAPRGSPDAAFMTLVGEAEASEFTGDLQKALARYRGATKAAASPSARALADMRIGRVLYKLRQYEAGLERYRAVMESAGDLTDANGIPYVVSALRQMSDGFAALQRTSDRQDAERRLREYVIRRPWNVADGYEYHLSLVRTRGGATDSSSASRIRRLQHGLDRIAWIQRDLVPRLATNRNDADGAWRPVSVRAGDVAIVGWTAARLEDGRAIGLAYELPPSSISGPLLHHVLKTVDLGGDISVAVLHPGMRSEGALTSADLDALPGWRVALLHRRGHSLQQLVARERFIYGTFIGGMVLVLIAGIVFTARASAREAELARLRTHFVASVSHELKTPLALIRMFGETLDSGILGTDEQRRECYGVIRRESERLSHLIDNVLDAARIGAGTKQYSLHDADLTAIAREAVDAYRPFFERQGFDVEIALPAAPIRVRADRDAVIQALINLFHNAIKYSAEAKHVTVSAVGRDGEARLAVADRGVGIPAAEIPRIFDRYYRVRANGMNGAAGTGLGLSLVAHAMAAHGGRVDVESSPGAGSVFTLVFPSIGADKAGPS